MKFLYGFSLICVSLISEVYGFLNIATEVLKPCRAERNEPWSYRLLDLKAKNGPKYWGVNFANCTGREQSPIKLSSVSAIQDGTLERLTLNNYNISITQGTILNNGHTIEVIPEDGVRRTILVNGVEYDLQQLHFHWGSSINVPFVGVLSTGSEHILDGIQYAMEMHLVHMSEDGAIAVVGVFFQEQNDNPEMEKIVDQLSDVRYKDESQNLDSDIDLLNLVPANPTSYFRYQGSLTTPPCTEGVTWSVIPDPMSIGRDQLAEFRGVYSVREGDATESCKLTDNYRFVQPLNGRQVFRSQ